MHLGASFTAKSNTKEDTMAANILIYGKAG
jgi:hypothetical protein